MLCSGGVKKMFTVLCRYSLSTSYMDVSIINSSLKVLFECSNPKFFSLYCDVNAFFGKAKNDGSNFLTYFFFRGYSKMDLVGFFER